MTDAYDVIIIGGGSAGENVAGRTAPAGLSTAIVEAELVGGECSYWACMPSKALLRPGEALAAAKRVPAVRDAVTGSVDAARAMRARDAFASHWSDAGQEQWVASVGAALIRGWGRLDGEKRVVVEMADGSGSIELEANKAVVLATGSVAFVPPIEGLVEAEPWTSREITSAKSVPESLIIIGGGVVGLEMAQAWKSLGTAEVTVLERRTPEDTPLFEPFALRAVVDSLEAQGVVFRFGCVVAAAARTDDGVSVTMDNGETLHAQELLVAAGRTGVVEGVGLETVGVDAQRYVQVNDHLQVEGVDGGWLYAVGDVNGRALLTHQGQVPGAAGGRPHPRARRLRLGGQRHGARGGVHRPADRQRGAHGARSARARPEHPRYRDGLAGRRRAAARRALHRRRQVHRGRGPARARRRDVRGAGGRRADARGDHRHRGRGDARPPLARDAVVPHPQ